MPDIRHSAYFQNLHLDLLEKIKERYGEKSDILDFFEEYEVAKGKALIERMKVGTSLQEEKVRGSFLMAARVADYQNMVVASHKFAFGRIFVVPPQAPAHYVCAGRALESTNVRFYIIDESEIYALKRER